MDRIINGLNELNIDNELNKCTINNLFDDINYVKKIILKKELELLIYKIKLGFVHYCDKNVIDYNENKYFCDTINISYSSYGNSSINYEYVIKNNKDIIVYVNINELKIKDECNIKIIVLQDGYEEKVFEHNNIKRHDVDNDIHDFLYCRSKSYKYFIAKYPYQNDFFKCWFKLFGYIHDEVVSSSIEKYLC